MESLESIKKEPNPEEMIDILKNDHGILPSLAGGQVDLLLAMSNQEEGDRPVSEMILAGFEQDLDFVGLAQFLRENFGQSFAQKLAIKEINYQKDTVYFRLAQKHYYIPLENFLSLTKTFPSLVEYKLRAQAFSKWNSQLRLQQDKTLLNTPINIFAFLPSDLAKAQYLEDVVEEDKMKLYKLGTVAHELAHHLYDYLFSEEDLLAWAKVVDAENFSTGYADSYDETNFSNDEKFSEAVRLYTTVPQYLASHFPEVFAFIKNKLDALLKQD